MKHSFGVLTVDPFQKPNLIRIFVCRPQHASIIIAQHNKLKMHPRTQVTIQIIKRGIGTILVLACFLAASQICNQRGKKTIRLGCISMFQYFRSLYYSRVKHASIGKRQPRAFNAWRPWFQSKVRVQRLNL